MSQEKKSSPLQEWLIIMSVTFASEMIGKFIHYPTPIVGVIVLLLLFIFNIIRPEHIQNVGNGLLAVISIMFVPLGIGLINILGTLKENAFSLLCTVFVTTILIMVITGWLSQFLLAMFSKKEK